MAPSPYFFIISICPVDMNVYARFDEIPSMTLKVIKKTNCNGQTDGRTDNVKTVYPPTNTVCGGYNILLFIIKYAPSSSGKMYPNIPETQTMVVIILKMYKKSPNCRENITKKKQVEWQTVQTLILSDLGLQFAVSRASIIFQKRFPDPVSS